MTVISPHIAQAAARERVADLRRHADASRVARQGRPAGASSSPASRSQSRREAQRDLIPAGTQKR